MAMMESIAVVVVVTALLKGLERWATPLMVRFRPRGVIDPSGIGFDLGHGHVGGVDSGC